VRHRPGRPTTTAGNIAHWTGECGDAAGALRLSEELLPDRVRVLGPLHPATLTTRSNIAHWTGECGDAAGALRLSEESRGGDSAGITPPLTRPGGNSDGVPRCPGAVPA